MSERHWSFRGRFPAFVLLLGLLCLRTVSWSQATQGSIVGNVKDSAGAVVAGAAVTLTNIDEGVARTTQSNRTGDYAFLDAKAAHYTLTVEAPGFEKFEAKDVTLEVRQELRLDAKLAVGAVQQQVDSIIKIGFRSRDMSIAIIAQACLICLLHAVDQRLVAWRYCLCCDIWLLLCRRCALCLRIRTGEKWGDVAFGACVAT